MEVARNKDGKKMKRGSCPQLEDTPIVFRIAYRETYNDGKEGTCSRSDGTRC